MERMARVAIVISTQYGQTAKIADRIRGALGDADVFCAPQLPQGLDAFDAVVIGAPVYYGGYPKELIAWTKVHARNLNEMPVAFFSVSLNASGTTIAARREDARLIAKFMESTGLRTELTASLAGTAHYRKYGVLKRWLLQAICARMGAPTDRSRDHELTDWATVDQFAATVAQHKRSARPEG